MWLATYRYRSPSLLLSRSKIRLSSSMKAGFIWKVGGMWLIMRVLFESSIIIYYSLLSFLFIVGSHFSMYSEYSMPILLGCLSGFLSGVFGIKSLRNVDGLLSCILILVSIIFLLILSLVTMEV